MGPDSMFIFNKNISQKVSVNLSVKNFSDQQASRSSPSEYSSSDEWNNNMMFCNNRGSVWYSRVLNSRTLENSEVQLSDYFLGSKYVLSKSLQVNILLVKLILLLVLFDLTYGLK